MVQLMSAWISGLIDKIRDTCSTIFAPKQELEGPACLIAGWERNVLQIAFGISYLYEVGRLAEVLGRFHCAYMFSCV